MKLYRKKDLNKVGIYAIINMINNKIYIGKSINIYQRMKEHITRLNTKNKDENIHLIRAWHKYGKNNFKYIVLEYIDDPNEDILKHRELYWITSLKSTDRKIGYNLRLDTATKCILSDETKLKLKESRKLRSIKYPELDKEIGKKVSAFWKNHQYAKEKMSKKISTLKRKYYFVQYSKSGEFIKKWNSIDDIISNNPSYKWQNIYSVCNGYKSSIYGYIWIKFLITNEDIVRSLDKSKIESTELITL